MKTISKSFCGIAAALVVTGATLAPSVVLAWGDSSNGRASYTESQIQSGVLGDKIVFNSISYNKVIGGDEKNFVAARYDNGNNGTANKWEADEITVEDGKTYVVRLYVHNDNPNGEKATATGVKASFNLPIEISKEQTIVGYLDSTNAEQKRIWDEVKFKANTAFYLEYKDGSALFENNGMGSTKLSNDIITKNGATLGYDKLDGEIPGCYQYDGVVTIRVTAHFVDSLVEKSVRIKDSGNKYTTESIDAKVGDLLEYKIHYKNTSASTLNNVTLRDLLPNNVEYVANTTYLYNTNYPKGVLLKDNTLTTAGLNIGNYSANGDAYVYFTGKVVDKSLACGKNELVNWANVTINGKVASKDDVSVFTTKTCKEDPKDPVNPVKPGEVLPKTGPTEIVTGALGAGSIVTALGYFIASRKKLM